MGVHVQCTSAKKLVSSNFVKILEVATKIRETCEKTLFTPPSPTKLLTLSFLFKQLDVAKIASICLAIGCRKIASKCLAIRHSQITSNFLAILDLQIVIAYLAIKEHKIAESI
jgi:hypothetical protein